MRSGTLAPAANLKPAPARPPLRSAAGCSPVRALFECRDVDFSSGRTGGRGRWVVGRGDARGGGGKGGLRGGGGGRRRNAFLVGRLFGRLRHSAKTSPEKAAPSPGDFGGLT